MQMGLVWWSPEKGKLDLGGQGAPVGKMLPYMYVPRVSRAGRATRRLLRALSKHDPPRRSEGAWVVPKGGWGQGKIILEPSALTQDMCWSSQICHRHRKCGTLTEAKMLTCYSTTSILDLAIRALIAWPSMNSVDKNTFKPLSTPSPDPLTWSLSQAFMAQSWVKYRAGCR